MMLKRLIGVLLTAALVALPCASANAARALHPLTCETTTTAGTGTINLGGASGSYLPFSSLFTSGDTVSYGITSGSGTYETGHGTYTSGAPGTLTRTLESSSTGSLLSLTGTSTVCAELNAEWLQPNLGITDAPQFGSIELGNATDTTLSRLAAGREGVEGVPVNNFTAAASAPVSPQVGDTWLNTNTLVKFQYVNDGDSSQWVELSPGGSAATGSPFEASNVGLAVSAAGGALTISLKTAAAADPSGTSPVIIPFRDVTEATGDQTTLTITTAQSLTVTSGATLNVTSSKGFRLWVVGFNDAGTFRLGVINCLSVTGDPPTAVQIFPINEWGVASSTAVSGASSSSGVFYTGTAVTSKAYRVLGFIEWNATGLTAGTWTTTNLSRIQVFGPGVNLPGQVVQTNYAITQPVFSITSTTYVSTGHTLAITPISAANIIYVQASAILWKNAGVGEAWAQLSRGTTAATNLFGAGADIFDAAGAAKFAVLQSLVGYDRPNTTSSQTYAVQAKESSASTSTWGNTGDNASFTLQEIMD